MTLNVVKSTVNGIEYSFHRCPKRFKEDLKNIFPDREPDELIIIPTCQQTSIDMSNFGDHVEQEKDYLLEKFCEWADRICQYLIKNEGCWAEYIDPCSGLPMINKKYMKPYGEVEACSILLGYKTVNVGCCKIVLHPKWGSSVYLASLFTDANEVQLERAIDLIDN